MKYGFFDDLNREYVINIPDTPLPWINYLGNTDFFSLISNTAGGYSFYKDALYRRITRYRYNNVPLDDGGRYFYIKDGSTIWSPGWKPVKTALDFYECRHGLGYTKITGEKNGISCQNLFFVPQGVNGEIQKITLQNKSNQKKEIQLFSMIEFCLWNAQDDMTNFQRNLNTGEVEIDQSTIYHKTEYRERRNHYAFYSVNCKIDGFDTNLRSFLGQYNGFNDPEVVKQGKPGNSKADGWSPIGSHFFNLTLEPGQSKDLIFILGYVENLDEDKWDSQGNLNKQVANKMINQFNDTEKVEQAFLKLKQDWNELLFNFELQSPEDRVDRMVNTWNQYQCMTTFNMGRSASYFESGIGRGLGFRDTNQDLLGFVHQVPERAKQRILDVAATQLESGGAYHQYQPLTKKGNDAVGGNFNDDPLWLILAVSAYIKETGDWSILEIRVDFENDSRKADTLLEHIRRSFYHVVNNLGPHNLPLIGRADWNDCLNLNCYSKNPDDSFQTCTNKDGRIAESILIAGMFVFIGRDFVSICQKIGKTELAKDAESEIHKMEQAIEKHGWDREWYLRAYDDSGSKIGSEENQEGKIYIESQGFCSMAKIGIDKNMPQKALDSVKELLDSKYGISLLYPAYTKYYLNLGEVSSYPQGYKENGGIFCHNNPWIMIGEAIIGRGDRAFEYYSKICPSFLEDISEKHGTEPYVYAQMIAGKEAPRHGEAKNSWLTGTAAWNFVAITQWILGIRPEFDGLKIDPCIPSTWDKYTVKRKFRNTNYEITIKNPQGFCKGVKKIIIDGKEHDSQILPLFKDDQNHLVEVILGKKED